jgi:hypothetical protein
LLAHSGNVTDLLQVENSLSQRESEVESLAAQSNALHAQVARATISVDLSMTPAPAPKPAPSHHIPGFLSGLRTGAAAFANVALVVATAAGFALPFLPVLALFVVVFVLTRRLSRRRREANTPV